MKVITFIGIFLKIEFFHSHFLVLASHNVVIVIQDSKKIVFVLEAFLQSPLITSLSNSHIIMTIFLKKEFKRNY
jgi:hypothetical protein